MLEIVQNVISVTKDTVSFIMHMPLVLMVQIFETLPILLEKHMKTHASIWKKYSKKRGMI